MPATSAGSTHGLSKSKLLSWLQCPKRLWLEAKQPEVVHVSDDSQRWIDTGHDVGRVAQQLQRGGILVGEQGNLSKALAQTTEHIQAGARILFEPTFLHAGVLVRADILKRKPFSRFQLREVKSSASIKDYHYHDAAIQAWVLRGAGLKVDSVVLQHINSKFVYGGNQDYRGLFTAKGIDSDIRPLRRDVPKWVAGARATLDRGEPTRSTGKHCNDPFDCPCLEYCSSKEPRTKYPVSILPNAGKTITKLLDEGYRDVRQVPADRLTSENQERVRRVTKSGKAELDTEARSAVGAIPYPRYYFDFETVGFAVPIWAGTRPYQQIPFQWSCHIERSSGKLEHRSFIAASGESPIQACADSLLETLGEAGPILAHNAGFEIARIRELAAMLPKRAKALTRLIPRFQDTLALTRSYYYHPAMMGSWSLKAIVPTIAPDLDYGNLGEVQDGGAASEAYLEMIAPATSNERKAELRSALERYCARDTLALVRLVRLLGSA